MLVGDEALIGGVVQDDGVVLLGVSHPLLELLAGVGCAGGVVGAADVDDVCLHAVVRHPKEAVLLIGAAVDDLAAVGHVVVHIGGVDGVRNQNGVVHVKQAQHVGQVALGTVGDEDLVLVQLGIAACVVTLNGLFQEGVALLRAVAVEAFLGAHLGGGILHGRHDALGQRLRHVADAQTDDLLFGVCFLIGRDLVGNVHEQVAGFQLAVMMIHFHNVFPQFLILDCSPSQSASRPAVLPLSHMRHLPPAGGSLSQRGSFFEKGSFPGLPKPLTLGEVASRKR